MTAPTRTLSIADARTLFLSGQSLLGPRARASTASVVRLVRRLGFVQLDSIQRVERAHHLILGARLDAYRPAMLDRAAFEKRALFEHWTHDASLVPIEHLAQWKLRFARAEARARASKWFTERLGSDPARTLAAVRSRIESEGALRARDFVREVPGKSAGWWDWSPEKAALELLWRMGVLGVARRDDFHKVYDLMERLHPEASTIATPSRDEAIEWACWAAIDRLGVATPSEIAGYFGAVSIAEATAWCRKSESDGRLVAVRVGPGEREPARPAFAVHDFARRIARAADAPPGIRLLAPFDPIVRDRKRLERLFSFDYRFEAFTPAARRVHGYYVMPMLEGDRLIGRLDPRHDRERGALVVEAVWWERGVRPTRARRSALEAALDELAERIGATTVELPRSRRGFPAV